MNKFWDGEAMPSRAPVTAVVQKSHYRNGSVSQDLLPLWQGRGEAMPSRALVTAVVRKSHYRNGTE